MSVFFKPVFDSTVVAGDHELFKAQGAAAQWARLVGAEIGAELAPKKIGSGWALVGTVDGEEVVYGIYGQRIKRIN
ncbi:hypothetical protein SAMN06265795_103151 [Noviherbaspirillum humi]|uniref:Uncharacterized protein n=1 Tax=Noviherbaspirillum humi TaxID=1688639 RepID=A0A239F4R5_9BURK|nr:hypothetical protein [Noviherbaspirillum humi]SNS51243.1 hypothetical protein SAMN06265795_103151 [Noviherbaspirillum humi]